MLSISIPQNIKINTGINFISVKGPLGTIVKYISKVNFIVKDSKLYCISNSNFTVQQTYLCILRNIIFGVFKGYRRKLRLIGVGFKALIKENILTLKLGYSHEVNYIIPSDVKISCSKNKGVIILISGIENARVNQVAVEIRRLRIPDVYKGKGIHYNKEILKLKKGKREGK